MRIVFLNMADKQGGLSRKTVSSIRKKYPTYNGWNLRRYYFDNNTIEEYDLIPLYEKWVAGRLDLDWLAKMLQIMVSCDIADKIMLGVHGNVGDTDNAYIADFGKPSPRVSCANLVEFFLLCLPTRGERFHVALIMCFGARAEDHLADHTGAMSAQAVKSSFAYKFYKLACRRRSLLMTGRTGSVHFDDSTGRSMVQTEAAVAAEAEFNELQDASATKQIAELHERLFETEFNRRGNVDRITDMEGAIIAELDRGRTDWSSASFEQLILIRYQKMRRTVQRLAQTKDASLAKFGKFVYLYDPTTQTVTVTRKYPHNQVIYQGPL